MSSLSYTLDHLAWQQRVLRERLDNDRLRRSLTSFTPRSTSSTAESELVVSNPNQLRDSLTPCLPAKFRIVPVTAALTRSQTTRLYCLLSLPTLPQPSIPPLSPQLPSKPPSRRAVKPASQPVSRPSSRPGTPQIPPSRPQTSLSWKTTSTQNRQIEELERLLQEEREVMAYIEAKAGGRAPPIAPFSRKIGL